MDQDDSMISSASSPGDGTYDDDDNLFPETHNNNVDSTTTVARPQTPRNDHLNAAAPGELSPPRSQSTNINLGGGGGGDDVVRPGDTEDLSPTAANRTVLQQQEQEEWKPGQGWKNKKAQEDMQRAWDSIVDREFSLKEFGDVMAHRLSK